MTSESLAGLGKKAKGYAKELVAEFTGDARLQEEGRREIVEGRREGIASTSDDSSSVSPRGGARETPDQLPGAALESWQGQPR